MLGVYLKLDQKILAYGDFSAENKLTGTIYTDEALTTAKNLTGYTLTLKFYKRWSNTAFLSAQATIVSAVNGTWSYEVKENELPQPDVYLVKIELSKSGTRESTLNTAQILIREGPSG